MEMIYSLTQNFMHFDLLWKIFFCQIDRIFIGFSQAFLKYF